MTQSEHLDAISATVQEIRESQIRHEALHPHCMDRFEHLESTIDGNGKSGLKSDVVRLKVWLGLVAPGCGLVGAIVGFFLEKFLG